MKSLAEGSDWLHQLELMLIACSSLLMKHGPEIAGDRMWDQLLIYPAAHLLTLIEPISEHTFHI
jgi:hypothetical protein